MILVIEVMTVAAFIRWTRYRPSLCTSLNASKKPRLYDFVVIRVRFPYLDQERLTGRK